MSNHFRDTGWTPFLAFLALLTVTFVAITITGMIWSAIYHWKYFLGAVGAGFSIGFATLRFRTDEWSSPRSICCMLIMIHTVLAALVTCFAIGCYGLAMSIWPRYVVISLLAGALFVIIILPLLRHISKAFRQILDELLIGLAGN